MESESRQTQAPTTWDGSPISHESPRGATIVVFRRRSHGPEFLMLHRAHHGVDYDGDWAWTPPSGVRLLGEPIITCAQRELLEETGLVLSLAPTDCGDEDWWVFLAEVSDEASVTLSDEHDQYAWWPGQIAITRCHPSRACEPLKAAVLLIEQARRRPR